MCVLCITAFDVKDRKALPLNVLIQESHVRRLVEVDSAERGENARSKCFRMIPVL